MNKELKAFYTNSTFEVKQSVGIDRSKLLVARSGVRGSNDLVWVGRAANYAAKLCSMRSGNLNSWITSDVYDYLLDEAKYGKDKVSMWTQKNWPEFNISVYASSWWWKP